jgi:hypothetical protein
MKKFEIYLSITITLILALGLISYFWSSSSRNNNNATTVSTVKEAKFRADVQNLDSLYHSFKQLLTTDDQTATAAIYAKLGDKFAAMQEQYGGTSLPAQLAAKLLNNYKQLILLNKQLINKKAESSVAVNSIKQLIAAEEKTNQDLKAINMMLQQAQLANPPAIPK